ncbi:MAG: ComEC/Rec2 family competence protein [Bilophila wadsworthia]
MPPVPPLQPLLFWETGVLLFVAGIVTARFPVPALTACALFAWVDSRTRRPLCCLLAAACVIAGWWIGEKSVPRVPQEYPAWLEKSLSSRRAVTVEGVIVGSRGLPDQRLQIILDDVGPAEKEPLPGRMALTWQDMPDVPRPLPGQWITADLKIRPVHGFHNQGTWNSEDYWHRQGVFFQAWAKQDDAAIRTSGTPSAGAELRERLRLRVAAALDPPEESGLRTLSPSSTDRNASRQAALPSQTLGANRLHPHGGSSRPLLSRLGRCRLKRSGTFRFACALRSSGGYEALFKGAGRRIFHHPGLAVRGSLGSTRRTWSASTRRG